MHYFFIFWYNVICVNCDVCEGVHVWYKYTITLYNLITKKFKGFVTCVYYYDVIITFCYKTSDSRKRKKKIVKLVIVKCIIYVW